jgi:endo-1,4-beta-xylanase
VSLTLPSGATISNAWNARRSADGGAVRFTNMDYNGRIGAGQFTEFGFQSSGSGSGLKPTCTAA